MSSRFDPKDPGQDPEYCNGLSGRGRTTPRLLLCACGWSGDFSDAVAHFRLTDHVLTYRGVRQNLEAFRVTPEECEARR